MVEMDGIIDHIVYKNDENGYVVAKLKSSKDMVAIVGYIPFLKEGQQVKIQGEWTVHQTFGQQIKVDNCEEVVPSTTEGIEKYLASGLITGIGPVTAKKIVEKFGADSLDVIEMNPERLTEIEGIGSKKAASIAESAREKRELQKVMVFLQAHGISTNYGIKIYKRYGNDAIKLVKENPYRLCEDISGIGFKTSDKISRSLGMDMASPFRAAAGIKYILSSATGNGHTYLPKLTLIDEAVKLLNVPEDMIENAIITLITQKQLVLEEVEDDVAVYLSTLYYSELGTARKLVELSINSPKTEIKDIAKEIDDYEKSSHIQLAEEQKKAVSEAVKNGVCIITGGPGTGKTTIIKCIIDIFQNNQMNVVLAAPTGRAAKRITETTGWEAKTIHRLLEMGYIPEENEPMFARDESNPIEADAVIIDEASMIDIIIMNSLLKAIPVNTKLVMVGDVDQLPSVGPGNVLKDIIQSGAVGVVRLTKIFRQSDESLIAVNAHRINKGEMPVLNDREKDFFFLQNNNPQDVVSEVQQLVDRRLPQFKRGFDSKKDIQVLSPMRKGEAGVYNLNTSLQATLNPPSPEKEEKQSGDVVLRQGDKVMQIKNNYNIDWTRVSGDGELEGTGVFNGDMGIIDKIDNENRMLSVIFDEEKRVWYDFSSLDELELAYAVTIHKSQGSEFPVAIISITYGPPMLMTRNLIYTAVTRAKKLVVIVGSRQALMGMINNNTITRRYSGLKSHIESIIKVMR
jgi:exodeoxyribonuclease V alpha subunit